MPGSMFYDPAADSNAPNPHSYLDLKILLDSIVWYPVRCIKQYWIYQPHFKVLYILYIKSLQSTHDLHPVSLILILPFVNHLHLFQLLNLCLPGGCLVCCLTYLSLCMESLLLKVKIPQQPAQFDSISISWIYEESVDLYHPS